MDAYMGSICLFPYDFVPMYWMRCDGQLLQISTEAALFSLIGTKYGGNGTTTFALPKLPPVKLSNGSLLYYVINTMGTYPSRP